MVFQQSADISEGVLVLVKEDNLPPMQWKLGRIVGITRGTDGVARVFRIKTRDGVIVRFFSQILSQVDFR